MSQRGFISLPVVIAAVLGLGLGASMYLNYAQHQRADQDKKLMQGEITDLRYQVQQDQLAKGSPSPSPSDSPSPSPSPSPAVAGTSSVAISQYGVHFSVIDPIADLTYDMQKSGIYTVAGFTTQSLLAKYPGCKPGTLGMLVRKPKSTKPSLADKFIKAIGSYNYYYLASSTTCTGDQAGRDAIAAAKAALYNAALPTLSN